MWPLLPAQNVWSSDVYHANLPIPYSEGKLKHNMTLHIEDLPSSLLTLEHVAVTVRERREKEEEEREREEREKREKRVIIISYLGCLGNH